MLTFLIIFSTSLLVLIFGFLEMRFPLLAARWRFKFLKLFRQGSQPGAGRVEEDITVH